jgi:hypothetical protein
MSAAKGGYRSLYVDSFPIDHQSRVLAWIVSGSEGAQYEVDLGGKYREILFSSQSQVGKLQ